MVWQGFSQFCCGSFLQPKPLAVIGKNYLTLRQGTKEKCFRLQVLAVRISVLLHFCLISIYTGLIIQCPSSAPCFFFINTHSCIFKLDFTYRIRQNSLVAVVVEFVVAGISQQDPKTWSQGEKNLSCCIHPNLKNIEGQEKNEMKQIE